MPDLQAPMSFLTCLLVYLMQALVFCHLMAQCLGDQHFVTLLLYLNICILPQVSMLWWTLLNWCLVGSRNSISILSWRNSTSLTPVFYSLAMCYLQGEFQQTPKSLKKKVRDCPSQTNANKVHSFLWLSSIIIDNLEICRNGPLSKWISESNI